MRFFSSKNQAGYFLKQHFAPLKLSEMITAGRTFPVTARVDLQRGLETLFAGKYPARLMGIHTEFGHETLSFAHMTSNAHYMVLVGPLQFDEVDVGETLPARCLRHGMWLARAEDTPFAVLITPAERYGHVQGVSLEIAIHPGEAGLDLSRQFLDELEHLVTQAGIDLVDGSTRDGGVGRRPLGRMRNHGSRVPQSIPRRSVAAIRPISGSVWGP